MSTKSQSFKSLNMAALDTQVYRAIEKYGPLTRQEISERSDIALESICGAANRLLSEGLIELAGSKLNERTNKQNETLRVFTGQSVATKKSRKGELQFLRSEVELQRQEIAELQKKIEVTEATWARRVELIRKVLAKGKAA